MADYELKDTIEKAFNDLEHINNYDTQLRQDVELVISALDCGGIRVSENIGGSWVTNSWIKKAILLYFRLNKAHIFDASYTKFYDKIKLKFADYTAEMLQEESLRIVPNAIVRHGAYIGKNTILMPSFVNIGAYVGSNCMIDTWATVGSCAQIGNNVHLSGGVGVGGVLEPVQANATIIEDDCFIGARSEIVEGVVIGKGSVISMGVYIGSSTKIYNRDTKEIFYGKVPEYSVVVPGNLPSADGTHSTYAAIIIKQVDETTRKKIAINELLRL